jgi:hypothetical protein
MVQQNFRFGLKVVIVVIRLLLKENNTYDPFTTRQVFIMMQEWPIRPHQAIKPKIGVSAGGKATITSLPIITSRDYRYSLNDLRTWLVYLQKITEHNEPFMPALMKASTYITVHYRNDTHALSRCMDNVQPRTSSVWMEYILASHERHAECTRMKHVATHNS